VLFQEVQKTCWDARSDYEGLLGKFAANNTIIDKRFIQLDMELERVVELVGEKIKKEVGEITSNFGEVMEIEEVWRASSVVKVTLLEEKLECACGEIAQLSGCMVIIQGRVGELEDAVVEEVSDAEDEGAMSTSSLEFDLVENMVAIPIPPPVIHNTLIPIECLRLSFLHRFGRLLLHPMLRHMRRIWSIIGFWSIGLTQRLACRRSYSSISL
jgi:hypothetical protein